MEKFKCPVCKGRKGWYVTIGEGNHPDVRYKTKWKDCANCDGTGFLDWVENIVGKKIEPYTAVGKIDFTTHLITDKDAVFRMYFGEKND